MPKESRKENSEENDLEGVQDQGGKHGGRAGGHAKAAAASGHHAARRGHAQSVFGKALDGDSEISWSSLYRLGRSCWTDCTCCLGSEAF